MNPMKFFELLKLFVAVLFVGCFSSCGDNNETPVHNEEEKEEAIIACSVDNIVLNSDGGIETFSFSVNQDWSIKVLGNGSLERKLTVRAHVFSETAKEKIETAGGKAEVM